MKVISDACWICKNLDKEASKKDEPICSLLIAFPDEEIETEGVCPDFEEMSLPKCPRCGEELPEIKCDQTIAFTTYTFSKKRGKYIPYIDVMDVERPHCPKCNSEIPSQWFRSHIDDYLRVINLSGTHKQCVIDLQELPFNVKYVEFGEELPLTITIKKDEKDNSEKEKKKE